MHELHISCSHTEGHIAVWRAEMVLAVAEVSLVKN